MLQQENDMKDIFDLLLQAVKQTDTEGDIFKRIALPVSSGLRFIEVEEIVYLEAEGAYTNVYMKDGKQVFVSKRLKYFEDLLQSWKSFYRSHRSFIININCIKELNRNENYLLLDNLKKIPIARERKIEFEQLLLQFKLLIKL